MMIFVRQVSEGNFWDSVLKPYFQHCMKRKWDQNGMFEPPDKMPSGKEENFFLVPFLPPCSCCIFLTAGLKKG